MRILIEAHHPAHIHFFKKAVRLWRDRGDEVETIRAKRGFAIRTSAGLVG